MAATALVAPRCPGCDSGEVRAHGARAPGLETVVSGTRYVQPAYDTFECAACGLFFKSDVWSEDEERRYYAQLDPRKWDPAGLFPTEQIALGMLRGLRPGSRILDFGCATGRLLDALGPDYERFGVEPNPAGAEAARARGVRIVELADAGSSGAFDAIILSDVIEHMRRPTETLRALDRLLAPGATLIVCTGNADAPPCRRDVGGFWYFRNVEHLVMIGRRYCEGVARSLGYRIAEWRETSHYAMPLGKRLGQHVRDRAYWAFRRKGAAARILAAVPVVNRARRWPVPPPLECTADHVVVRFEKARPGGADA